MANKKLFQPKSQVLPEADVTNEAGGAAYSLDAQVALAQMACTSFLADQYYNDADDQLNQILKLCDQVPAEWVAKVAVYARRESYMKDMPSLLLAWLSIRWPVLADQIWRRVADNGRMIRNVVQIIRSGRIDGRHALPHVVRKNVAGWLNNARVKTVFSASVGNSPSLADVIKMVHPKPKDSERKALFGYIVGRPSVETDETQQVNYDWNSLPQEVRDYERFKSYMIAKEGRTLHDLLLNKPQPVSVPDLPFQMLDSLGLDRDEWRQIALTRDRFLFTLKNLNTFQRHGVFENEQAIEVVAKRLANKENIEKAMVFPYQVLAAYRAIQPVSMHGFGAIPDPVTMDQRIVGSLHDALEHSLRNVPEFEGKVAICVDISGSMHSPVSGSRGRATSVVRCLDVAALFGAAVFRKNKSARIYPFSNGVIPMNIEPRDTVTTISDKLCSYNGGATDWDAPLRMMHATKYYPDLCIYFSDMQGWVSDSVPVGYYRDEHASSAQKYWQMLSQKNKNARLIMVNLAAYTSVQVKEDERAMLVGGFTDEVFKVANQFHKGELDSARWVGRIEEAVKEI